MSGNLAEIVAQIDAAVGAVPGMRETAETTPEKISAGGVTRYVWPGAGSLSEATAGRVEGRHTITVVVATPLRNMRTDLERMRPFGDSVPRAILAAGTLDGKALQTSAVRYTFGEMELAGVTLLGWRFELDVLEMGALA